MKRIVLCASTRPEMIKIAPLYLEMKKREGLETILMSTGQHKEMLYQVCQAFNIKPDYDLEPKSRIMRTRIKSTRDYPENCVNLRSGVE